MLLPSCEETILKQTVNQEYFFYFSKYMYYIKASDLKIKKKNLKDLEIYTDFSFDMKMFRNNQHYQL